MKKKITDSKSPDRSRIPPAASEELFTNRIALTRLKEMCGQSVEGYTDAQLYKIRDFAYALCEVLYKVIHHHQVKNIHLSHEQIHERQKGDSLRPGEYRRAS